MPSGFVVITASLNIAFSSASRIGTGTGLGKLLDDLTTTDADGFPVVPGSTLKGRLRTHAERVHAALGGHSCSKCNPCSRGDCPLCRVFGSPLASGGLMFGPARLPKDLRDLLKGTNGIHSPLTNWRTNTMLSRVRCVVMEDRLFTRECVIDGLSFSARLEGALAPPVEKDIGLLWSAARAVTHVGGSRSRGLGECCMELTDVRLNGVSHTPSITGLGGAA